MDNVNMIANNDTLLYFDVAINPKSSSMQVKSELEALTEEVVGDDDLSRSKCKKKKRPGSFDSSRESNS
jgi:subtilase family serine protease